MGPSRKFLSGRASFLVYICKVFMVHFGRIDCWIHLWELKQLYLQIDIELKINVDTHHHSRISSNSSLKFVLHLEKYEAGSSACKMQDFICSVTFYSLLFLHWSSTLHHSWNLLHKCVLHILNAYLPFSLLSPHHILPSTQGCIPIMTGNHWSSKVAILLE